MIRSKYRILNTRNCTIMTLEIQKHISQDILKSNKLLNRILEDIQRYHEDPYYQIEDACKRLNLSRSQVFRKLRSQSETNFSELLTWFRITKAKNLLVKTDCTVSEICFRVGYNDPSYFVRCFKKIIGKTPGSYRDINSPKTLISSLELKPNLTQQMYQS